MRSGSNVLSVNKYGQKHLIDDIPEYGFALCITSQFYHVRWQQVPKGFREGSLKLLHKKLGIPIKTYVHSIHT